MPIPAFHTMFFFPAYLLRSRFPVHLVSRTPTSKSDLMEIGMVSYVIGARGTNVHASELTGAQ